MSWWRAESVVPVIVVLGAVVLAASEFMVAFEFTPPGGEPLRDTTGGDRHGFSNLILGVAAIGALAAAIATGSRPAAYAVAAIGSVALLLFLVIDLPDVGQVGDLRDPLRDLATAEAVPRPGFWLQAIGAVALAVGGGMFAKLRHDATEQPTSARPRTRRPSPREGAEVERRQARERATGERPRAGGRRAG